ncbi:hypothetical protein SBDP2_260009 [Syntrophobacter sp. SbD2]|nr:hypothetical protein SBDP2_260009 [Syntrophobacter sp. SbD2]
MREASYLQVSLCLTADSGAGPAGDIAGDPLQSGGHPALATGFHLSRPLTSIETALTFL